MTKKYPLKMNVVSQSIASSRTIKNGLRGLTSMDADMLESKQ